MSEWQDFNGFDERSFFGSFIHEMPLFFRLFALLFLGLFVFIIVKSVRIWMSNNASPLIKANCTAVTKRTEVWGGSGESRANTSYYVTFEFADGSRLELQVRDQDFGLIVEGDRGELLYQGTRFKSFNRDLKKEHLNF
ncbi:MULTISPECIES: DUF2500 domain-containing protein [unclassified Paenibacillus]|uniref:DUF2500 domain-containing protein n=1 Tax=unclassified Paenibacillus TaxID=185978 RepID=UPI0024772A0C|nr:MULTISPECIES: DUF2500 domain-containing protein [unclassified Paenibacillus]MDH6426852.1 hypothetical protein [Paenibacillus sp. PastH-4]MDH6442880.1 hypothetical protein [Paenibacillus sp. PastF-4]MDH6526412.1 hypothetical protein [Paenibacillus sp. PastH-3]